MKGNKLSFEFKGLTVDWISLSIKGSLNVKPIADYLFQILGFNSTIGKRIEGKWKSEPLNYHKQNRFQVYFAQHEYDPEFRSFWVGTKIEFSGKNAFQIYKVIQEEQFNWSIFKSYELSLSRFDLCYFLAKNSLDLKGDLELFMNKCYQKVCARSKKSIVVYSQRDQGSILNIGSRKSPNYYRIYETVNGIRFELEIKKPVLKLFENFLFSNSIQEFEDKLTRHFYAHSKKILVLDDLYTDWLIDYFRKTEKPLNFLVTSYLTETDLKNIKKSEFIFRFLQLLSFSRNYSSDIKELFSQNYHVIKFRVQDFMDFIRIKNKNHYQLKKIICFFHSIQNTVPTLTIFSENFFRSVSVIPLVDVYKEQNSWVVQILLAEQLYFYRYPFSLPPYFITYQTTYELQVKLKIIQVMSSERLEKVLEIQDSLEQFNLSTQKKASIKKLIIESLSQLKKHARIENKLKLIMKSGLIQEIDIENLSALILGQSKVIYFYEKF